MKSDPNLNILNRALAKSDGNTLIEMANPVLEELVNYSTSVYLRCLHAGNTTHEDVPAFVLYLHIMEMTDGIHVLISHSCCEPAVPLLRSSFEAFLSLRYLLEDDYRNRSQSWLYFDHLASSRRSQQLDPESDRGHELARVLSSEWPDFEIPVLSADQLDYVRSLPRRDAFESIANEYERTRRDRKIDRPEWYTLFDGPQNGQKLAEHLSFERLYIAVYRDWSALTHARDSSRFIEKMPDGTTWGHQLRLAENLAKYSYLAGFFLWAATDSILMKFRPFEPNHAKWSADMKNRLVGLSNIEIEVAGVPAPRG
jgi:hypothetical protein